MPAEAIFLHSSWRAASTYVWSKFRERSDTYCYFEPLTEHLATATPAFIDDFWPWPGAHHPPLDAPYLEEYRPLLGPGGGIPGFPDHLTLGRYCANPGDALPELDAYMARLAGLAAGRGRRPVYGFVRTDLRVGWFRARMSGAHVFIRREPRRQFLSMLRQGVGQNSYFLQRGLLILLNNLEEPAFAPLLAAIDVPALAHSPDMHELFRGKVGKQAPLRPLYLIFYFMRQLARQRGAAHCDLVMDIDRMSLDQSHRREVEDRLAALTGMSISFVDCRVERYEANIEWSTPFFDVLEQEVDALLPHRLRGE